MVAVEMDAKAGTFVEVFIRLFWAEKIRGKVLNLKTKKVKEFLESFLAF